MATLDSLKPLTMLSLANEIDPNGDAAKIIEILTKENAMLLDAPAQESNDVFSVTYTKRLSLPSGTFRAINEGVPVEAAHTRKETSPIAEIMSYCEIDRTLVDAHPNPELFRNNQAIAFIEGMGQTIASKILYGNTATNPKEPTGLAPHLDDYSQTNVVRNESSGGTVYTGSTCTSVYAVQWGEDQVSLFYPRGMRNTVGVEREDKGVVTQTTATTGQANTAQLEVYREVFTARFGLAVMDDRCIARLSNIKAEHRESTYPVNWEQLLELLAEMKKGGEGAVLYAPRVVYTQLAIQASKKANVQWGPNDPFGRPQLMFFGHPVRLMENILLTESALT